MNREISVEVTLDDHLEYMMAGVYTESIISKAKREKWIIFALLITCGVLFILKNLMAVGAVLIGLGLLHWIYYLTYHERRYRNHFRHQLYDQYSQGPYKVTYRFGDKNLHFSDETHSGSLAYNKISKVGETHNLLLLWQGDSHAIILPKRHVDGHANLIEFLEGRVKSSEYSC